MEGTIPKNRSLTRHKNLVLTGTAFGIGTRLNSHLVNIN